ncbi:MAG: hypothetical protein J7J87_01300 [Candidatus Diapherotrites archaeon]|nr:hypothetical protein [Candidatus Diapherotrites archaeon]
MGSAQILEEVMGKCEPIIERGLKERVTSKEAAEVLSSLLFEITEKLGQKLIEVRSYETIKEKGTFKYAGQVETLHSEGIFPEDLYKEFKELGLENHIGPSYLRVKGLLTHKRVRSFFARQLAYVIKDALERDPPKNEDRFVVFLPNMTGGAWIGDETMRHAESILEQKIWPASPYMRNMRKTVEVVAKESITNYVEGLLPEPEETAVIINFEELRTTAETTKNAIQILKNFGYNAEKGVKIKAACVFDYRHIAGVERLKRLGVESLYLIEGLNFFEVAKEQGYINDEQYRTVNDWLNDPWKYTRKVLPMVKELIGEKK